MAFPPNNISGNCYGDPFAPPDQARVPSIILNEVSGSIPPFRFAGIYRYAALDQGRTLFSCRPCPPSNIISRNSRRPQLQLPPEAAPSKRRPATLRSGMRKAGNCGRATIAHPVRRWSASNAASRSASIQPKLRSTRVERTRVTAQTADLRLIAHRLLYRLLDLHDPIYIRTRKALHYSAWPANLHFVDLCLGTKAKMRTTIA